METDRLFAALLAPFHRLRKRVGAGAASDARSDGQDEGGRRNTAESQEADKPTAEALRADMLRQIDGRRAQLSGQLSALRSRIDPTLEQSSRDLEAQIGNLDEIRERVATSHSVGHLAELSDRVRDTVANAGEAARSAEISAAAASPGGAGASGAGYTPADSRRFLMQSDARLDQRSTDLFGWGHRYGVDLSAEEEKERELKKREQELLAKGDVKGALAVHADRLGNQIGGYDKLIGSPAVPAAVKSQAQNARDQAVKELHETLDREAHLRVPPGLSPDKAAAWRQDFVATRMHQIVPHAAVGAHGDPAAEKAALDRRAARSEEQNAHLGRGTLQTDTASDGPAKNERKLAAVAEANHTAGKQLAAATDLDLGGGTAPQAAPLAPGHPAAANDAKPTAVPTKIALASGEGAHHNVEVPATPSAASAKPSGRATV